LADPSGSETVAGMVEGLHILQGQELWARIVTGIAKINITVKSRCFFCNKVVIRL